MLAGYVVIEAARDLFNDRETGESAPGIALAGRVSVPSIGIYCGPIMNGHRSSRPAYALAVQGPGNERVRFTLRGVEDISASEHKRLVEAVVAVNRLGHSYEYLLVERNFADLKSACQFVTAVLSLGRDFGVLNRRYVRDATFSPMLNWLTSALLYVDHSGIDIKRRFGKNSPEFEQFERARKAEYDQRLGYRFCYNLRNYFIHSQPPELAIKVDRPERLGMKSNLKQVARLLLKRDSLLSTWDRWQPVVAADISAMPESFDLQPLADDAMEGYRSIYDVVFDINLNDALRQTDLLRDALRRVGSLGEDEGPIFLEYRLDDADRIRNASPTFFPVTVVERLGQVLDGSASLESLKAQVEPPPRPPYDLRNVRRNFHRTSRGVEVLTAWLAANGDSADLNRVMNRIVREDGSVDDLISGLVTTSTTLASMAATLLGQSMSGLITGLLDLYPDAETWPDEPTDTDN